MTFEEREHIIHMDFVVKMGRMYYAPRVMKDDKAAQKQYGEELRRVVNQRLSTHIPNEDVFKQEIAKVWDRCIASHTMGTWFSPSTVAKAVSKVNADYVARTQAVDSTWEKLTKPGEEPEKPRASKNDPIGQGWTIEKCDWHINETQRLMDEEGLNRGMGQVLIRIPMKAKERLLALDKQHQNG